MNEQDLSALVSSRICHDLISPIGAISNGVELMQDMNPRSSPELGLIGDSVNTATAKLRYFRIAFGATPPGATIQMSEVRQATDAMFHGRTQLTFTDAPAEIPRMTGKLLLLTLLCVEKSLPLGGTIAVELAQDSIHISIRSDRFKPMEACWALADGGQPEELIAASEVQFLLLGRTLDSIRAKLDRSFTETGGVIALRGLFA